MTALVRFTFLALLMATGLLAGASVGVVEPTAASEQLVFAYDGDLDVAIAASPGSEGPVLAQILAVEAFSAVGHTYDLSRSQVAPSGLSPSSIRFSQSSVNNVDEIARSMRVNGWVGEPIDVLRMPDGSLVTLDNTRVLAAHQAGIDVQATIRAFDDPLTTEMAERFATAKGGVPSTWGEAITNRIGNQSAGYRTAWPDGSPVTGWDGN